MFFNSALAKLAIVSKIRNIWHTDMRAFLLFCLKISYYVNKRYDCYEFEECSMLCVCEGCCIVLKNWTISECNFSVILRKQLLLDEHMLRLKVIGLNYVTSCLCRVTSTTRSVAVS